MGYSIWPDTPDGDVLQEVHAERLRQDQLKAGGKFNWTCADLESTRGKRRDITHAERLTVLSEEVGEAAREVMEAIIAGDKGDGPEQVARVKALRKELVQVAAVCVAWCEAIDKGAVT